MADLLAQSFHVDSGVWGWLFPMFRLGIYEDLKYRLKSDASRYRCFVAIKEIEPNQNRLVGVVEMSVRRQALLQTHGGYLYLSNLAVEAEYRQQGIAQGLLSACEQLATIWGFRDLYLHVLEDNDRARRLYEKAGYRAKQTEITLFSWLLGRPRQILLHKHLAA
jgi:ribosomal protein S18 acetylase RimI-like enzyme